MSQTPLGPMELILSPLILMPNILPTKLLAWLLGTDLTILTVILPSQVLFSEKSFAKWWRKIQSIPFQVVWKDAIDTLLKEQLKTSTNLILNTEKGLPKITGSLLWNLDYDHLIKQTKILYIILLPKDLNFEKAFFI